MRALHVVICLPDSVRLHCSVRHKLVNDPTFTPQVQRLVVSRGIKRSRAADDALKLQLVLLL